MSVAKFMTIDAFFIIMNKSCVPAIVPEQSESALFVTLVEVHNVLVASNRDATVLSPTAATLQCQWPSAIAVDFEIESDLGSKSHT